MHATKSGKLILLTRSHKTLNPIDTPDTIPKKALRMARKVFYVLLTPKLFRRTFKETGVGTKSIYPGILIAALIEKEDSKQMVISSSLIDWFTLSSSNTIVVAPVSNDGGVIISDILAIFPIAAE